MSGVQSLPWHGVSFQRVLRIGRLPRLPRAPGGSQRVRAVREIMMTDGTSADARVQSLHRGVVIIAWAIGVGVAVTNTIAFSIPFLGGNSRWLDWVQLIPLTASVGCWVGTKSIRAAACVEPTGVVRASAAIAVLHIAAIVMVATRLVFFLALMGFAPEWALCVWGLRDLAEIVFAVTLLLHLRRRAHVMAMTGSARVCCAAALAVGAVLGADLVMALLDVPPLRSMVGVGSLAGALAAATPDLTVYFVIIAALIVFARRLLDSAAGRCATCGYALRGLSTAVCPECGIEFQGHPTKAPPVR